MIRLAQIAPMGRAGIATVSPRRRKIFPRFCSLMFLRCSGGGGGFFNLDRRHGFLCGFSRRLLRNRFFRRPDRYFFARQRHRCLSADFFDADAFVDCAFSSGALPGRGLSAAPAAAQLSRKTAAIAAGRPAILPMMSMFRNFPRAASILSSGDRVPLFGKRLVNNVKFVPAGSGTGLESARRMDHIADLQRNGTGRVR